MSGPPPLGYRLPPPPAAQGTYQPVAIHAGLAYTAGMTPRRDGVLKVTGRAGVELSVAQAREEAAVATANALSALASAAGSVERIERVLTMTVWVAAGEGFVEHTAVADGGSEMIARIVGGPPPARAAVGVHSLPGGAPVEVALVAALRTSHGEAGG